MSIDEEDFKHCVSNFATGVTVVTLEWQNDHLGLTVSSFCSVSLDPPLVSICIEKDARTHDPLLEGAGFTVNFLTEDQKPISKRFARPGLSMEKRFDETECTSHEIGGPVIQGGLGWIACEEYDHFPGGDHTVFLGKVMEGENYSDEPPLLYFKGDYGEYTAFDN
ncbi:MAG: flavin reductase family protein [bacterium]